MPTLSVLNSNICIFILFLHILFLHCDQKLTTILILQSYLRLTLWASPWSIFINVLSQRRMFISSINRCSNMYQINQVWSLKFFASLLMSMFAYVHQYASHPLADERDQSPTKWWLCHLDFQRCGSHFILASIFVKHFKQ